ncbi:hypothetical protein DQG23_10170 [Paenibacillus contaminans]|uniref:Uncharacterized protein n=1 Tax=Paenibacillus contaminans TaxID=450362 RepID=A0A329MPD3_9BACL|nr:hypothetical protein DQG23_10170 [Paenibacillus contaminans]
MDLGLSRKVKIDLGQPCFFGDEVRAFAFYSGSPVQYLHSGICYLLLVAFRYMMPIDTHFFLVYEFALSFYDGNGGFGYRNKAMSRILRIY